MPDKIFAEVFSSFTFTKYWPPVFLAEVLISATLPCKILLIDFTNTVTSVSLCICAISDSGTIASTSKLVGFSMLIKVIPGFAISPFLMFLLVTIPLKGAVILLYLNCASISFFC